MSDDGLEGAGPPSPHQRAQQSEQPSKGPAERISGDPLLMATLRPSTRKSAGSGGGGDDDEAVAAAAAATSVFVPGDSEGGGSDDFEGTDEDEDEFEAGQEEAGTSGVAISLPSSRGGSSSIAMSETSGIFGLVAGGAGGSGGLTIEEVLDEQGEGATTTAVGPAEKRQHQQAPRRPSRSANTTAPANPAPVVSVEAFFRTWLSTSGFTKTLETLQRESTERIKRRGSVGGGGSGIQPPQPVPSSSAPTLEQQLAGALSELSNERARFARESRRLAQEKAALAASVARLQARCEQQAPALAELRRRFEAATREAALARLERDRALREGGGGVVAGGTAATGASAGAPPSRRSSVAPTAAAPQPSPPPPTTAARTARRRSSPCLPAGPADSAAFGPLGANLPAADVASFKVLRVCRPPPLRPSTGGSGGQQQGQQAQGQGGGGAIAAVALHRGRPLLATASDDGAWRLWQPETGALVMTGEGHKDWVCAVDFMMASASVSSSSSSSPAPAQPPPTPLLLATAAGDGCVKLWEPARRRCAATLHEHSQAVWAVRFHPRGGAWLATASLDRTVRLWDCEVVVAAAAPSPSSSSPSSSSSSLSRSRLVLRGHTGSVNDVSWDPRGGFVLATASNDRTVCVWDARAGGARPVATLGGGGGGVGGGGGGESGGGGGSGWGAPVTSVSWSPGASSLLASTDAAGTLRLLDLRAAADAMAAGGGAAASSSSPSAAAELVACRCSPAGARSASFDASGAVVAVACDDGRVRCYAVDGRASGQAAGALLAELDARGAVGATAALTVSSVAFDRWWAAHGGGGSGGGGGGGANSSKLLVAGLSDGSWVGWGLGG